jgi:ketosteroid isomerase-like protein
MYEAVEAADHGSLRELLDPNVVWHIAGRSPLAGDHHGLEAVLALLARIYDLTDGSYRLELGDIVADDTYAVVLMRTTATLAATPFADEAAHVTRIAGERITDVRAYSSEQEHFDELVDDVLDSRA